MAETLATKSSQGKSAEQTQRPSRELTRQPASIGPYSDVLALQRSAGNYAVNHLLGQGSRALPSTGAVLQRKCACGNQARAGGECEECSKKKPLGLQTKLKVNEPEDMYEQEADRIADQVMATPAHQAVSGAPPRIQRFSGQSNGQMDVAPASVNQALTNSGRPLEPALRQDMEQRFGYDFSRVQVHTGAAAEQSARDVNAHAYTMGQDIVFGAGRFAPGTHEGRRLIAHELTHVVQQLGADAIRVGQSDDKRGLSPIASLIQQGQSAPSPIGVSIGRVPNRSIQRDEEPKKLEKGLGKAVEKAASKALEEAKSAALSELKEIESNWKEMRAPATGFSGVADWLTKGDTVIGLLRTHTELALDAMVKGDSALTKFMTSIVESDMVMYRFIAWHVAVYVNLVTLEPQMKDLADAFAADSRAFTGRADAEERVKLLRKLAAGYRKEAPEWLKLVKILPAEVTRSGGGKITLTVTIAAHSDKSVSELFAKQTETFINDLAAITTLVIATNQFLDTAFEEGLVQAAEAVIEFYSVRGSKNRGPKASKSKSKKKREKKEKKEEKKEEKKGGKYTCYGWSAVLQIPSALPEHKCPLDGHYVRGPSMSASSEAAACLAAKHAFNAMMPRGCRPKHLDCRCSKR